MKCTREKANTRLIMNTNSKQEVLTKWNVDPIHSELSFKIKHLMITIVTGYIKNFDMELHTLGADFGMVTSLELKASLNSLSTNHQARDSHLMSQDFFDVKNFPHLEFQSIKFEKQGLNQPSLLSAFRRDFTISGILNIKGFSRTIILNGDFGGLAMDLNGQKRAGFTVRGRINRKDYGLSWAGVLHSGKLIVSDEVDIIGNIQLIKQPL